MMLLAKQKKKKRGKGEIDVTLIEKGLQEYGDVDLKLLYAEEAEKKEKRRQEMWRSIDIANHTKNRTIESLMHGLYTDTIYKAAREYFQAIKRLEVAKKEKKPKKEEIEACEKDLRTMQMYYVLFVIDSLDTGTGAPYEDVLERLNNVAKNDKEIRFTKEMLDNVLQATQRRGTTYEKNPSMYKMA